MGEVPEAVAIHPANSREPDPLVEKLKGRLEEEPEVDRPAAEESVGEPNEEVSPADLRRARETARFVAERAFEFDDSEARAWALTDFSVWATLAGESAQLSFEAPGHDESAP